MVNIPFFNWFKNLSIAKKFYTAIGIMTILITVELGTLYFSFKTLSSVRACIASEGLWSKAQKDAIFYLQKYHRTQDSADEQAFYRFMKVPLDHHKILVELSKENPDLSIAKQVLLAGGNHPDDIDGMIKLFLRFENFSTLKQSFNIWAEADSIIFTLIPVAEKLHAEINSDSPSQIILDQIMEEVGPVNQKLTGLENDFSYTLGEGARTFEDTILTLLFSITISVGFCGLLLTYFIVNGVSKGLTEILDASKKVAEKDYSAKAKSFSTDEIGMLAHSFNDMTAQLENNIKQISQADQDIERKSRFIQENERRIVGIMEALIKTTQLNFTEKLIISDKGDEIDAIAVGLNTMSEELEFHLKQLKNSEEKLNKAQQLAKIGNWEWNTSTNAIEWSDELFRIFGMDRNNFEANYENYLKCIHPDDRAYADNIIQKAYNDHLPFDFFHRIVTPGGEELILHGRGEVSVNPTDNTKMMIGTVQDVTERKKAEQQLHQFNIELQRKNKDIEQFAYAASHDLQEPLRSISNFSKLLASKLQNHPDEDIKKYMSRISGGASRMSSLIFDLLEYSRIGKDMAKSLVDCNLVVQDVITDLSAIIECTGAIVQIDKLPVINSYDLKSVFQNLILNGLKFRKSGVSPIISVSSSETENAFIFTIKDNGIGIEKEYFNRIFVIFQRLHTRFEYEGTGIGLSLSKKIIELHDGEIWVESEFGTGSSFHFTIPKNNTNSL